MRDPVEVAASFKELPINVLLLVKLHLDHLNKVIPRDPLWLDILWSKPNLYHQEVHLQVDVLVSLMLTPITKVVLASI